MPAVLRNPWTFVPLLYFMQAIPVTIVQEVATIFYKDLGVANDPIVRWTSLISLPWSLQLLLGPLVDLNGTKRNWILGGQALIAVGLIATALLLRVPYAFEITLLILGATAVTSALCNIATDGFYIISMAKDQQAKFVGVQTTCYRLGRLFCTGLLVLFVGLLMRFEPLPVTAPEGSSLTVAKDGRERMVSSVSLVIDQGLLKTRGGETVLGVPVEGKDGKTSREIQAPAGVFGLECSPEGEVVALRVTGKEPFGRLALATAADPAAPATGLVVGQSKPGISPAVAWPAILLAAALIYGLGSLINRKTVPRPAEDRPAVPSEENETRKNILRTVVLLGIGVGGYFTLNAAVRLIAHAASGGSLFGWSLAGWRLPEPNTIIGFDLGIGSVGAELAQLVVCGLVVAGTLAAARRLIVGTPMGDAFSSFVRQQGIWAIFFFILTYRFGEAMVAKMSPLFLKDSIVNGGLAVQNEQLGLIKGVAGVIGIVLGGLAGGWVVARLGLRRAFWLLAICMHVPNLLYLWASYAHPPIAYLYGVDFVDQFGYGFGFAGYMVYLMWVAQRGSYKTAHYAIGTGMGALCIAIAGVVSGVLQKNFGYHGFFIWVIFLTIPGMLALLFIPLDDQHSKPARA